MVVGVVASNLDDSKLSINYAIMMLISYHARTIYFAYPSILDNK
jgi:hypothetical protein